MSLILLLVVLSNNFITAIIKSDTTVNNIGVYIFYFHKKFQKQAWLSIYPWHYAHTPRGKQEKITGHSLQIRTAEVKDFQYRAHVLQNVRPWEICNTTCSNSYLKVPGFNGYKRKYKLFMVKRKEIITSINAAVLSEFKIYPTICLIPFIIKIWNN